MNNKINNRFLYSFILSILIHSVIIFGVLLIKQSHPSLAKTQKVKLENLLVLKRGQSEDISKTKEGAKKPMIASQKSLNTQQTPIVQSSPIISNNIQVQKQQKKQNDSEKKALDTYKETSIDPKNLSFIMQNIPMSFGEIKRQNIENDKGNDPQTIQEINELYGEEFGDLGMAQKEYIRDNLRHIGRITQRYLQYPRVAAYFGQSGINAVEFYLHPNGDISELKIIKPSGLNSFDGNTLHTIKIAYKDYPRPKVKTLIRINVTYSYYGH